VASKTRWKMDAEGRTNNIVWTTFQSYLKANKCVTYLQTIKWKKVHEQKVKIFCTLFTYHKNICKKWKRMETFFGRKQIFNVCRADCELIKGKWKTDCSLVIISQKMDGKVDRISLNG